MTTRAPGATVTRERVNDPQRDDADNASGTLIAIEGIDGSGKTTLAENLAARLRDEEHPITLTREPGGTDLGQKIRRLLLNPKHAPTPITELLLYAADRAEHVQRVIRPALHNGETVMTDHYTGNTIAYQQHARRLPPQAVQDLNHLATGGLRPHPTILLDITPARALERARDRREDRLETDTLDHHHLLRRAYHLQAANDPTWAVIDTERPPHVVLLDTLAHVEITAGGAT